MNPQIFSKRPIAKSNCGFDAFFRRVVMVILALQVGAHALFLDGPIIAERVANGLIVVDGRPDGVWKTLASRGAVPTTINFSDYQKIVLLQADKIRNADPKLYFTAPNQGSVTMLAAYDNTALYFFFLVKENTIFNPSTLCTATNLWKANAPEVYIDPSPWNPDNFSAYFSVDGSGLLFGTSPKTVQLDKPIYAKDLRSFFRNRLTPPDRFQIPTSIPNGVVAIASAHSPSDSLLVGVEMKIPFWTGAATDFSPGKSMFISWGYNHYPNAGKANCDSTPIAYRWAKHYKSYDPADPDKPAGWRAGDSTHFDPTRSWDGWGQFLLNNGPVFTAGCNFSDTASWDINSWKANCSTVTSVKSTAHNFPAIRMPRLGTDYSWGGMSRDAQGRIHQREVKTKVIPITNFLKIKNRPS
jgi:hypothetical protein